MISILTTTQDQGGNIMRRTKGLDVKISTDSTGGMVSVDWHCPYCGQYNAGFYFSGNSKDMQGSFEIDHECDSCGKMVTIECSDSEALF